MKHLDINASEHHDAFMRTTLTLDDDLARQLKKIARTTGRPFKEVVNETIRRSLAIGDPPPPPAPRFVVEATPRGFRRGVDPQKLNQLTDELAIEDFERKRERG